MAKSSKKLKIGHVQDTPVSTSMISNECMICHMKVHIVSYNLDPKKFSKSKIQILTNDDEVENCRLSSFLLAVCIICHMKVHIVSYNLDQKKFSKSKIHILTNYEQMDLKTATVILSEAVSLSIDGSDISLVKFSPPLLYLAAISPKFSTASWS